MVVKPVRKLSIWNLISQEVGIVVVIEDEVEEGVEVINGEALGVEASRAVVQESLSYLARECKVFCINRWHGVLRV